jgi:hypothetical protein
MRWTDLPRDREPADDREGPVVRRGEWEDLKQRLERLPPAHPSSLDDEDPADGDWTEDERVGGERADRAAGRSAGRGGQAGPDRPARLAGGHEAGRLPDPDRREPYRPWFASGDSSDPWFSADPDA